ncbi:hypothetical protein [Catelliglobosispora koreensis]|uniref:hypothetical protein n=1 Tax=Catelliglobosispora koreensis TaxID=129052 RepID=UPI00035D57AA|nr:hypothetical protein [Catelliglobosispora koreensis]
MQTNPGWAQNVWGVVVMIAGALGILLSLVSRGDEGGLLLSCTLLLLGQLMRIEAAVRDRSGTP